MNNHVPFLDLITPQLEDEEALLSVCREALHTGRFIGGPMVEEFEQQFAAFCDTKYCVGVGSGTDALRFGLIAAGIRQDDIVITVPNTFIATTEAISQAGAYPAFVDIEPWTSTMDPKRLRQYLDGEIVRADQGPARPFTGIPAAGCPVSSRCICTGRQPTWMRSGRSATSTA